jgi:hypothetical protein
MPNVDQPCIDCSVDSHTLVVEAHRIGSLLLQELEQNPVNPEDPDDTVVALHFNRSSIYRLVTLLQQLSLSASKSKAS